MGIIRRIPIMDMEVEGRELMLGKRSSLALVPMPVWVVSHHWQVGPMVNFLLNHSRRQWATNNLYTEPIQLQRSLQFLAMLLLAMLLLSPQEFRK